MADLFSKRGLPEVQVTDLDYSAEMLKLSPNADKVLADINSSACIEANKMTERYDGFECSCPHRITDLSTLFQNANRALVTGGILWMKIENIYFHPEFEKSLKKSGFELIEELNTEIRLPTEFFRDVDPLIQGKIKDATRKTRFLFAKKVSRPKETSIDDFKFVKTLAPKEELDHIKKLLQDALKPKTDLKHITWAHELQETVSQISLDNIKNKSHFMTAFLKHAMRLTHHEEINLVKGRNNSNAELKKLITILDRDLAKMEIDNTDKKEPIYLYLSQLKKIGTIIAERII